MLTTVVSIRASYNFNSYAFTYDGITYRTTSEKTCKVSENDDNEALTAVTIPSKVQFEGKWYTVTAVGDWCFNNCWNLDSIKLPDSVTSIGNMSFSG